jgi:hypothetical protein
MRCLDVLRFEVGVIGEHFVPGAPWANGPTITETGMRQPQIQAPPPRILQSKAMRSSIVSLLLCLADPSETPTAAPKPRKGSIIVGAKSRVRHDVETGIGSIQRRCGVA